SAVGQGTVTVQVQSLNDETRTASATAMVSTAGDLPLTLTGVAVNTFERSTFSGTVAMLGDADPAATTFTSTIQWGDGTSSAGTVTSTGTGTYSVQGAHVYLDE